MVKSNVGILITRHQNQILLPGVTASTNGKNVKKSLVTALNNARIIRKRTFEKVDVE